MVDGNRIPCVAPRPTKDLMVFLSQMFEDVLGGDEQVWEELHKPVGQCDDEIVPVLIVHCFHKLQNFGLNGRVVK